MDANILITAIWVGLAIGAIVSVILTLMTLPTSYIMNTFAYHHWSIRLLLMLPMVLPFIITATTIWLAAPWYILWSLIALVPNLFLLLTVFAWKKAHYYGLFPLYETVGGSAEPTGFFAFLFKFFLLAIHPIVMVTDTEAIRMSLGSLIVKDLPSGEEIDGKKYYPGFVNEDITKAAMAAGSMNGKGWNTLMESLTKAATVIYGSVGSAQEEKEEEAEEEVAEEEEAPSSNKSQQSVEPKMNDGFIWFLGTKRLGTVTEIKEIEQNGQHVEHIRATFENGESMESNTPGLRGEPANPLAPILAQYRKEIQTAIVETEAHYSALIGALTKENKEKIVAAVSEKYKGAVTTALEAKTLPTTEHPVEIMNDILANLSTEDQDKILLEVANTLLEEKKYQIISDIAGNLDETKQQEISTAILQNIPEKHKAAVMAELGKKLASAGIDPSMIPL